MACLGVNLHPHRVHSHPSFIVPPLVCTAHGLLYSSCQIDVMGGNVLSSLVRSMVDDAEAADADVDDDKLLLFVLCVAVCVDDNDEGDRDKAVVVSSGGS